MELKKYSIYMRKRNRFFATIISITLLLTGCFDANRKGRSFRPYLIISVM